jgi:hypothetical protein
MINKLPLDQPTDHALTYQRGRSFLRISDGLHNRMEGPRNVEEKEIRALESSLKGLSQSLAELGGGKDIEELIHVIHGPGYTTEVEHYFVAGITDSLAQQVQNLTWLKNLLIEGTRVIGEPDAKGKKTNQPTPAPPIRTGGPTVIKAQ